MAQSVQGTGFDLTRPIWTLEARDSVMLEVIQSYLGLSDDAIRAEIYDGLRIVVDTLQKKGVAYDDLRSALVPQRRRREVALLFDTARIESGMYGVAAAEHVVPHLPRQLNCAFNIGDLILENDSKQHPLPKFLTGWDYQTILRLSREAQVDVAEIRTATRLDGDVELRLGVLWSVAETGLRGRAADFTLSAGGEQSIVIDCELPGRNLGGTLLLETRVFVARSPENPARYSASRAGSVLWSDRTRCRLQGDAPLFPVAIVDFAAFGFDTRAPWSLQIRPDLDAPAMGAIHLLVNSKNQAVVDALAKAGDPLPEHEAILSTLYYDAGRTLVEFALSREEIADETFDEDSLGVVLQGLLMSLFSPADAKSLRQLKDTDPTRWSADLAAGLGLMGWKAR